MAADQKTAYVHKDSEAEVSRLTASTELSTAAGALVGFNGETPIAAPVLATGTAATVDDVITVLQTLGLVVQE